VGGAGLPIRRCAREAILAQRILRTRGLCVGVCCAGRIRRRRLRRGTILRALLLRPVMGVSTSFLLGGIMCFHGGAGSGERGLFWLRISFGVLALDVVYILTLPSPRHLRVNIMHIMEIKHLQSRAFLSSHGPNVSDPECKYPSSCPPYTLH